MPCSVSSSGRLCSNYLTPPPRLVLDLDSTDFVLHGHQLGRFFHGYYDAYCYLPLYIFCGDHPLLALLRPSNIDNAVGVLKHLSVSSLGCENAGPGWRSSCGVTAAFGATT